MRKIANVFLNLLLISVIVGIFTKCKKEEIVIVYSKIATVSTYNTTSTSTGVDGFIEELTEATHNSYGFCWDAVNEPTVYDNKIVLSGSAAEGTFSGVISNLKPATTYYVRAFVIDNKKYIYGSDMAFTTLDATLPVVATTYVTGITSEYAVSGGDVTSEGDKPVIAKGVCFDTVASPTILKNKTADGWGTGSYVSFLNNLVPSKIYYVRAYAVSEFGVSYGSQVSFTTLDEKLSFTEEFDGNSGNDWYSGSNTYGSASITNGEYVCNYNQEGYLWRVYSNISGFSTMANSKDFEINYSIAISSYGTVTLNTVTVGGLVWDCASSNFKYFIIKKPYLSSGYYYYSVGSYNGSYTTWQSYTSFAASDTNKLTIKKANGYYYFFINNVQVYKHTYSSISYDDIGFMIQNAEIHVDYFYMEQKSDKKTSETIRFMQALRSKHDLIRYIEDR